MAHTDSTAVKCTNRRYYAIKARLVMSAGEVPRASSQMPVTKPRSCPQAGGWLSNAASKKVSLSLCAWCACVCGVCVCCMHVWIYVCIGVCVCFMYVLVCVCVCVCVFDLLL